MAIGAVLAWVCGVLGAAHEGVQLSVNGLKPVLPWRLWRGARGRALTTDA